MSEAFYIVMLLLIAAACIFIKVAISSARRHPNGAMGAGLSSFSVVLLVTIILIVFISNAYHKAKRAGQMRDYRARTERTIDTRNGEPG
ncbi:hypothetical protein M5D96_007255 [Drosophila gunungcola]|uniref:Uncharacterized protein n=1 Tax=Drosophila gunungcola TaxID=103775 RepID=A0A9Q0BPW4_9MUSC|nr:hypothetical protein M5D96_007255 [Drosophila gunungcola]